MINSSTQITSRPIGIIQQAFALTEDVNTLMLNYANSFAGSVEPSPAVAQMMWIDNSTNTVKQRNLLNTAWVTIGTTTSAGIIAWAGTGSANYAASAGFATSALYAVYATNAVTSAVATSAIWATSADYAYSAGVATSSDYASSAGYSTSAGSVTSSIYATSADFATTASLATSATHSSSASYATSAGTASSADFATFATSASFVPSANYATSAGFATVAGSVTGNVNSADWAVSANYAGSAGIATSAGYALTATTAVSATYSNTAGYSNSAGYASSASLATSAGFALSATTATSATYATTAGAISGAATSANWATSAGYATTAGTVTSATYATSSHFAISADFASIASSASYAINSTTATSATYANTSGYSNSAGFATSAGYATNAGNASSVSFTNIASASYATSANFASTATSATYASSAGFSIIATSASFALFATSAGNATTASSAIDTVYRYNMTAQKEPTGFESRTSSTISFTSASMVFNISAVSGTFNVFAQGNHFPIASASITVSATIGLHYIYFDTSANIQQSTVSWDIASGNIPIVSVYWNGTKGMINDERHGIQMDGATHKYLHDTRGTAYERGLTLTASAAAASLTEGVIWDEDIEFTISAQTTFPVFYFSGDSTWQWTDKQTTLYYQVANRAQYNNGTALANVTNNNFVAYWLFATDSPDHPIMSIMGQRIDSSLQNAQTNALPSSLTLAGLPSAEIKLLYRVIISVTGTTNETVVDITDYRTSSLLGVTGYLATNHSTLTGLTNLDHPAGAIINTPAGNIVATDVQSAINELDTEKLAVSGQAVSAIYAGSAGTATSSTYSTSSNYATITGSLSNSNPTNMLQNPNFAYWLNSTSTTTSFDTIATNCMLIQSSANLSISKSSYQPTASAGLASANCALLTIIANAASSGTGILLVKTQVEPFTVPSARNMTYTIQTIASSANIGFNTVVAIAVYSDGSEQGLGNQYPSAFTNTNLTNSSFVFALPVSDKVIVRFRILVYFHTGVYGNSVGSTLQVIKNKLELGDRFTGFETICPTNDLNNLQGVYASNYPVDVIPGTPATSAGMITVPIDYNSNITDYSQSINFTAMATTPATAIYAPVTGSANTATVFGVSSGAAYNKAVNVGGKSSFLNGINFSVSGITATDSVISYYYVANSNVY